MLEALLLSSCDSEQDTCPSRSSPPQKSTKEPTMGVETMTLSSGVWNLEHKGRERIVNVGREFLPMWFFSSCLYFSCLNLHTAAMKSSLAASRKDLIV